MTRFRALTARSRSKELPRLRLMRSPLCCAEDRRTRFAGNPSDQGGRPTASTRGWTAAPAHTHPGSQPDTAAATRSGVPGCAAASPAPTPSPSPGSDLDAVSPWPAPRHGCARKLAPRVLRRLLWVLRMPPPDRLALALTVGTRSTAAPARGRFSRRSFCAAHLPRPLPHVLRFFRFTSSGSPRDTSPGTRGSPAVLLLAIPLRVVPASDRPQRSPQPTAPARRASPAGVPTRSQPCRMRVGWSANRSRRRVVDAGGHYDSAGASSSNVWNRAYR